MEENKIEANITVECEEPQQTNKPNSTKPKRVNGKKLRKIRNQMEFYFSDANLQKDRLLGKLIQDDDQGYVDLEVFLKFNCIKFITDNTKDIVKAVSWSNILEVNKNATRIRRKQPFLPKKIKCDEFTIYVEKLPAHANLKFVKNIFQNFGNVTYISLPHFRNSEKNKGFAFVEFDSAECVKRACECSRFSSEDENEDNLEVPIRKIERNKKVDDVPNVKCKDMSLTKYSRKRKKSETINEKIPEKVSKTTVENTDHKGDSSKSHKQDPLSAKKKRKRHGSESEPVTPKKSKVSDASGINDCVSEIESEIPKESSECSLVAEPTEPKCDNECKVSTESPPENKSSDIEVKHENIKNDDLNEQITTPVNQDQEKVESKDEVKSSEGRKRKRKKASDGEKLKLRVMSLADWKNYRNRYLSMQRKAMSTIKRMLLIDRQQRTECESMLCHTAPNKVEQTDRIADESNEKSKETNVKYQKGVVIKVGMSKNTELPSPDELWKQVKSAVDDIAYIDTSTVDDSTLFIRFHSPDTALSATKSEVLKALGSCEIIAGEEESLYWKKLESDRQTQRSRQRPKKRGRDKILAKSAKLLEQKNTHIFFD